jgi:hypothetical protein
MAALAFGVLVLHTVAVGGTGPEGVIDLAGRPSDPFASAARVRVFVFVRADCPITNRYAPELLRIAHVFPIDDVQIWLVYADPQTTAPQIRNHMMQYGFPGQPLRDPQQELVKRAHAVTAPEAAVFDGAGKLVYHGRIDDLWVDAGRARQMARTHDLEDAIEDTLTGRAVHQSETRAVGCSLADVK